MPGVVFALREFTFCAVSGVRDKESKIKKSVYNMPLSNKSFLGLYQRTLKW